MSRHLPPLRLFGVFETVCRTNSLRAAAAALNVSQPAVSQSLRQLEDHIGARLINRNTRPASLTTEGEILLRATEDGLGRISGAVDEIRRHLAQRGSSVTVTCSVGVATLWLMPHLESFYCDHPDVQVNVITSESGAPTIAGDVDIAIRFGDGSWSDGMVTPLLEERIEPVCTPELAARLALTPDSLHSAPLIHGPALARLDGLSHHPRPRPTEQSCAAPVLELCAGDPGGACGPRRRPRLAHHYRRSCQ